MFSLKRYNKLGQKDLDTDDEDVRSTTIKDFGASQYDHSADLHLPNVQSSEHVSYFQCLTLGCLYACLLVTFSVMTVTAAGYASWFIQDTGPEVTANPTTISWRREFDALTELSAETYDVNGDGILDVLTSGASGTCMSIVRALDGSNGDTLFETKLTFDVFALNCNADLNLDGHFDCLLAGRFGGFAAIRGQDGTVLWYVDSSIIFPRYGFYFPLVVRDLDGDGVMDVINTHGGDTIYAPGNRNRSTGFLVVVSGRTGGKLMNRIPVPDGKETYSSPVLYRRPDGVEMVVFGTGGETIEGSLWAMSLDSIQRSVQEYTGQIKDNYNPLHEFLNPFCTNADTSSTESLRPVYNPSLYKMNHIGDINCVPWGYAKHVWTSLGLCVYQILASKHKGIMLPVLLVDMNEDSQLDLVISIFGGHTAVLDGMSLAVIWDKHFPESESYSVPSPVYFNSDNIPDILVRVNFGTWNVYQYSDVAILDGRSGEGLWTMRSTGTVMSSSVVLRAHHHGNDGALFITLGQSSTTQHTSRGTEKGNGICFRDCLDNPSNGCNGLPATGTQVTRDANSGEGNSASPSQHNSSDLWVGGDFPNPETDFDGFLHYCNFTKERLSSHTYFIAPHMILSGQVKPLDTFPPYVDVKAHRRRDAQHSSPVDMRTQSPQTLRCMHVLSPNVLPATPALSDLNGDGEVEVIVVTNWGPIDGRYQAFSYEVRVYTLRQKAQQIFGSTIDLSQFLPMSQQPWTKYMGKMGTGVCIG